MKSYYWCRYCKSGAILESTKGQGAIPLTCGCHDDWQQMEWIGDDAEGADNLAILENGGIDHRGLRRDRLRRHKLPWPPGTEHLNWERMFIAEWVSENRRRSGLNHGLGTLELLLTQDDEAAKESRPTMISQRDADVAACVIQWLGTNCGRCFLESVNRTAKKERKRIEERNRAAREAELATTAARGAGI